jgi:hypothetical protein
MGPLLVINYRNEKKSSCEKQFKKQKNDKENQSYYMIESIHEDITYVKLGFAL